GWPKWELFRSACTLNRFNLLNKLKKLARNSSLAPSPRTFMLGNPKALLSVASISKYRGPVNALRSIPGGPGIGPGVAVPFTIDRNDGPGVKVGGRKYAAAPLGKSPPVLMNAALL